MELVADLEAILADAHRQGVKIPYWFAVRLDAATLTWTWKNVPHPLNLRLQAASGVEIVVYFIADNLPEVARVH